MNFNIEEWYENKAKGEVLLAYKGTITMDLITKVLDTIENKLDNTQESLKIKKRLYYILVETLQNLYHHISEAPQRERETMGDNFAMFIISKKESNYQITTGNFIREENVPQLRDRLAQISYLTKEELKELYKLILSNIELSKKGGGSLGIIDIIRKTENKVNYQFHQYDKDFYFFCLEVTIAI
jgi:hypothetical protein